MPGLAAEDVGAAGCLEDVVALVAEDQGVVLAVAVEDVGVLGPLQDLVVARARASGRTAIAQRHDGDRRRASP